MFLSHFPTIVAHSYWKTWRAVTPVGSRHSDPGHFFRCRALLTELTQPCCNMSIAYGCVSEIIVSYVSVFAFGKKEMSFIKWTYSAKQLVKYLEYIQGNAIKIQDTNIRYYHSINLCSRLYECFHMWKQSKRKTSLGFCFWWNLHTGSDLEPGTVLMNGYVFLQNLVSSKVQRQLNCGKSQRIIQPCDLETFVLPMFTFPPQKVLLVALRFIFICFWEHGFSCTFLWDAAKLRWTETRCGGVSYFYHLKTEKEVRPTGGPAEGSGSCL